MRKFENEAHIHTTTGGSYKAGIQYDPGPRRQPPTVRNAWIHGNLGMATIVPQYRSGNELSLRLEYTFEGDIG
jgi:hypothetical protein